MQTVNLKDQITKLVQLQGIDKEIYGLRDEKESKPAELQKLEAFLEEKKKTLADAEKEMQNLLKAKKDQEIELGTKEEATKKLQSQLYQLKTNKDYAAMLQQIGGSKADASRIEDRILEILDKIDAQKSRVEQEKKTLQEEEKKIGGEKGKVQARVKEIEEKLAQLQISRDKLQPGIDHKILSRYEKVMLNRGGIGIAPVKNDMCGGCNMFVPAQTINLIKMYETMITCEMCQRILYLESDIENP
ncbi:MAG: C4-type zinc ribbon domain-containing protein [Candidatus Omnitrophica bacterium]|nr:C4-type zinc ribbon domain-containing protein [Candidatus Omnitrophota bacterium]